MCYAPNLEVVVAVARHPVATWEAARSGVRLLLLPPAWGTLGLHHAASSLVGSYPKVPTKGRMGLVVLVGSLPKVPTYCVLGGVEPTQRFSPDILSGFMVT